MKRLIASILLTLCMGSMSTALHAALPKKSRAEFEKTFMPAIMHRGLIVGNQPIEPSKLRTFVVLTQGGIPAGRAPHFISLGDYDYFPSYIRENSLYKSRPLKPYTYLSAGTVMTVTKVYYRANKITLDLLSLKPINPDNSKHPSRLSAKLSFEFQSGEINNSDINPLIRSISEWLKPFESFPAAEDYATSLTPPISEKERSKP